MALARITRGPLTAYSIFLMQGFMFSKTTVGAMMEVLVYRLREVTSKPCLKLIIARLGTDKTSGRHWKDFLGRRKLKTKIKQY